MISHGDTIPLPSLTAPTERLDETAEDQLIDTIAHGLVVAGCPPERLDALIQRVVTRIAAREHARPTMRLWRRVCGVERVRVDGAWRVV